MMTDELPEWQQRAIHNYGSLIHQERAMYRSRNRWMCVAIVIALGAIVWGVWL